MYKKRILKKISNKQISPEEGFNKLYRSKIPRARFIKMMMNFKEHRVMSLIFAILFALPFPIGIAKVIPKKAFEKSEIDKKSFLILLASGKGTTVEIISKEANIFICII